VTVLSDPPAPQIPLENEPSLEHIRRTKELRVGYNESILPFCYRNGQGQLAGYDVAFAYQLAADLKVNLRFIPFHWITLADDLKAHRFDIAMSGVYITEDRLSKYKASAPYFQSPTAFFLPADRAEAFRDGEKIRARKDLRIGVFNDPLLQEEARQSFPNATIVVISNYRTEPDFSKVDAALWTLTQAEAVARSRPDLVAVEPTGFSDPHLFAYLMPPGDEGFCNFVSYWQQLKKTDGFADAQQRYWIERQPRTDAAPRWSILRDVLGVGR
jgi:ABC-type amino acid transport substrate-binding protein